MIKNRSVEYYINNYIIATLKSRLLDDFAYSLVNENFQNEYIEDEVTQEIKRAESDREHYMELLEESVDSEEEYLSYMNYAEMQILHAFPKIDRRATEGEAKALREIEEHNRDMLENPDSYFEPDDDRRGW